MGGGENSGASKTKSEPNVVPLCDILLVLLIIFMVLTPLLAKGPNLKLPEINNSQDEPESDKMITVYLNKEGKIFLDTKEVTDLSKLANMIEDRMDEKKQTERNKVLLRADKELAYGRIVEAMDEIRRAQIEVIGLVAEKSTNSEK